MASQVPAIDCDVHPTLPGMGTLTPYLDESWRETFSVRGIDTMDLSTAGNPKGSPLPVRPDWRPGSGGAQLAGRPSMVMA